MEKRFSIIISAYNIEDYIKRAIKSVLEQDFKNLAHDESNIKILDSQRSNVTKKILKPYMLSNLITSIFNK